MIGTVEGLWLPVALLAGYLAVVVWIVVPGSHWCHDTTCDRLKTERKGD